MPPFSESAFWLTMNKLILFSKTVNLARSRFWCHTGRFSRLLDVILVNAPKHYEFTFCWTIHGSIATFSANPLILKGTWEMEPGECQANK